MNLTEGGLLDGQHYDGVLDLLRHAILQHWLLAADFLQSQFAALVVELLEAVEAVAAVAHHLAGLADIAELLRKLQQANLGTDDLLFSRHDVLQCRGGALRHPDRSAPRLGLRFAVGIGHRCQIKFWLMQCFASLSASSAIARCAIAASPRTG